MWNKPSMWNNTKIWNSPKMWNSLKMWNRPKEVEQAQRGGTGPKINHTFQQGWDRPKEVEQPQGGGGRGKEEAGHVATLPRREVVTIRARPALMARYHAAEWCTKQPRCNVATPRSGHRCLQRPVAALMYHRQRRTKLNLIRFEIQIQIKLNSNSTP